MYNFNVLKLKLNNLFNRYDFNNKNHRRVTIATLIVLLLLILLFIWNFNQKKPIPIEEIKYNYPTADIADNVDTVDLKDLDETEDKDENNNPTTNSGQAPSPNPTPQPQTKLTDLGSIYKIEYSANKSLTLALIYDKTNAKDNSSLLNFFAPQVNAQDVPSEFTLAIADSKGIVKQVIEEKSVLDAEFVDNDYVFYQKVKTAAGVYKFDIAKNSKQVVEYTYETASFENITMIDSSKYFFIQANTGKIGFGQIGSTNKTMIDEKLMPTNSNYAKRSAYKFAQVSPDKNYVAFLDLTPLEDNKVTIILLPVNATKLEDTYFSTKIALASRGLAPNEELIKWSSNSKFLNVGDDSTVIDIANKKVVHQLDSSDYGFGELSPDFSSLFISNFSKQTAYILNLTNNQKIDLFAGITRAKWLNNNNMILVIGKRLYVYNLTNKNLKQISTKEASYEIMDVNPSLMKALIKSDNNIFEITVK